MIRHDRKEAMQLVASDRTLAPFVAANWRGGLRLTASGLVSRLSSLGLATLQSPGGVLRVAATWSEAAFEQEHDAARFRRLTSIRAIHGLEGSNVAASAVRVFPAERLRSANRRTPPGLCKRAG